MLTLELGMVAHTVIPVLERPKQKDYLSSGICDQPGQHSESLQKHKVGLEV
jgi:hypothetical protein